VCVCVRACVCVFLLLCLFLWVWSDLKNYWNNMNTNLCESYNALKRTTSYFLDMPSFRVVFQCIELAAVSKGKSMRDKGLYNAALVCRTHLTLFAEVSRYVFALISRRGMIKHVISVCRCNRTPKHTRVSPHTSLLTGILNSLLRHTCM